MSINPLLLLIILFANAIANIVLLFANIFSHLIVCLFILSVVSFAVQKILSLIRSKLFIAFIFFSRQIQKKLLLWLRLKSVLWFPLGVLQLEVLHLGLQSIFSSFLLIVSENVHVIFLHVSVQFSQNHSLKRVFSPLYVLVSFVVD